MPGTATVTGVIGPGRALAASVFQNVSSFCLDTKNELLEIEHDSGMGRIKAQIDVSASVTWTLTASGNTYTLTVANS